jgi:lipopolysaccharide/colanic/teichoic acid biosynthesis glycosyltransferase/cellulose synthase/poly-beta-1,6-N-acetylglucosamine synthase-like glycosyltransferase
VNPIDLTLFLLLCLTILVIAYHHIGYPLLLRSLAGKRLSGAANGLAEVEPAGPRLAELPSVTIIVPAHNEERYIAAKLENLAKLDYPNDLLNVVLVLDGCVDDTYEVAAKALSRLPSEFQVEIEIHERNIGKIAVLNHHVGNATTDIVALTDASALIDPDALIRAARHFADQKVGVVCGTYRLSEAGSEGERAYWNYQTEIKLHEAALAAPMGAHGAFYAFRKPLWQPLSADTINDDFFIPMRIVANGYRAVYDQQIVAVELERTEARQEFRRRVRIGAGNMQQTLRLARLASTRNAWLAFLFLSGKGLRPIIPFLIILAVFLTIALAFRAGTLFQLILAAELSAFALAAYVMTHRKLAVPRPVAWLGYLIEGHTASFLGAMQFITGHGNTGWTPSRSVEWRSNSNFSYVPWGVATAKRAFDVAGAVAGIIILSVVAIPIALIIKLESPGPVIYRQRRVGRVTPTATHVFDLMKFRTMRQDAEKASGPVWATTNDPRVTRVGEFLRKSRLDELPQLINVLKGDMSLVGPRPERPIFFKMLDREIPFYGERTFGLRPGITGLAQVNQDYDSSIEDVKRKILFDHAYAVRLATLGTWFAADVEIILKTLGVMAKQKGR